MNDKVFVTNGCSSHSKTTRQENDYYATPYIATEKLLKAEAFSKNILEPFVGGGHIAEILEKNGYRVECADIVDRGWHDTKISNFLEQKETPINADIVSNPPYKDVADCWERACERITEGHKVAYMLKLSFLEGQERQILFRKYPPSRVLVFSKRITCAKNGDFEHYKNSAIAHAWFIYEKGNKKNPIADWI